MQLETNPDLPPPVPEPSGSGINRRAVLAASLAVLVVLVVVGAFALMVQAGTTDIFRDISIILLAVVMIVIGLLLLVLIVQLALLTKMLNEEIKPLLQNLQETVSTARGTTIFLSEHVVQPAIGAAGTMAGFARMLGLLSELARVWRRR
jgi:Na+/H+-dicarboxylate symporter